MTKVTKLVRVGEFADSDGQLNVYGTVNGGGNMSVPRTYGKGELNVFSGCVISLGNLQLVAAPWTTKRKSLPVCQAGLIRLNGINILVNNHQQ